jgi:hypothetical protein
MEDASSCSICTEGYNQGALCPRILPCGHTFCVKCLATIANSGRVVCPNDRKTFAVPDVANLPKNFALLDVIEAAGQAQPAASAPLTCEVCEEKHVSTHHCVECNENMCREMALAHQRQKATKTHQVLTHEQLWANPVAVPVVCQEHNQPFAFFDEKCQRVVCQHCVVLDHNGHKCQSLAVAASSRKQDLTAMSAEAEAFSHQLRDAERGVASVRGNLAKSFTRADNEIHSIFEQVVCVFICVSRFLTHTIPEQARRDMTAREANLRCKLQQLRKDKDIILTNQQDQLLTFQACLASVSSRAREAATHPGDATVVVAHTDIAATLAAMKKQPPLMVPQEDAELQFDIDRAALQKTINSAGDVKGVARSV